MQDEWPNQDFDDNDALPSKTKRKQEMRALQEMGAELTRLNARQLALIPLDLPLSKALNEFRNLPNSHEARRRQLQFIGKLMRRSDHEAIATALRQLREPNRGEIRRGQLIEQWSQKLLDGDEQTITDFLEAFPAAERQPLRQLQRRYRLAENDDARASARRRLIDYVKIYC